MDRMIKLSLRFLLIMSAVAVIPVTLDSPGPDGSPYLSALSDLSFQPALAAACKNVICPAMPGRIRCAPFNGFNCKLRLNPTFSCEETPC